MYGVNKGKLMLEDWLILFWEIYMMIISIFRYNTLKKVIISLQLGILIWFYHETLLRKLVRYGINGL